MGEEIEINPSLENLKNNKSTSPILLTTNEGEWDVPKDFPILYFDAELSYELSGYKPIDRTRGLDFNPEWFIETRLTFIDTGKYCTAEPKSKLYRDFWNELYRRCRNGLTVKGYTITGDNYFFLNFYNLPNLNSTSKAGTGRSIGFPNFYVKQYEYFHYIELCKRLRKNSIGVKARGVGFSEIGASIVDNTYICRRNSRSCVVAEKSIFVEATLDKCWRCLSNLDLTAEGFAKNRQVHDTAMYKRASSLTVDKKEYGWMSETLGIVADTPNKIRGDRFDLMIYEESGSWKSFIKAFIQGDALVYIQGKKFGIKIGWGTGKHIDI